MEGVVSVIMNCFNGERWLREAIDSVFAQTYRRWEIIFWDNRSTDESAAIARSYGDRVRYFRSASAVPLGAARAMAVNEACGEHIAFLDCDDIWFPEKLEKQVQAMRSGSFALCYGGVITIDSEGRKLRRLEAQERSGDLFDALLHQFDVQLPTAMVRRSALEESGLNFDSAVVASEEYCLFMQLAARFPVSSFAAPLAFYRVHEGSLTNATMAIWADEREYTLRLIEKALPGIRRSHRRGFREAYARARYYRARLSVARRERGGALKVLAPAALVHPRYAALTVLLLLPLSVWDGIHARRSGRRIFSIK